MSSLGRQTKVFMEDLMDEVLLAAYKKALPEVQRTGRRGTLAKAMERKRGRYLRTKRGISGRLNIPYYWAIFVHQGRDPFTSETMMVWWRNPEDDPRRARFGGITPQRRSQLRSLTQQEYRDAVEARRAHIAAGGSALTAPVIITRAIRKATPAKPFFSNTGGMSGFGQQGRAIIARRFDQFVKGSLGDSAQVRDSATARI